VYYPRRVKLGVAEVDSAPVEVDSLGPQLPLRLGRYTLCEELGAGGMATVYLARMELDAGVTKLVALKTIHRHLARERAFVDMFLDEAKIASRVNHPNVCTTFDFGQIGGTYVLAMEYLIGEPLVDVINRAAADATDEVLEVIPFLAARVIADAAEGLHAAHAAAGADGRPLGVVHRDVSPQNLFVTYEGSVKVVDFGCAKAFERVSQTQNGVLKGKLAYAAPEQIRNEDVDARADVWGLGVCLWETLTLSSLFHRDDGALAVAQAVVQDEIPRPEDGRPWVPEAVADIAMKCLQRNPQDRYATARELGRELRGFITDSGVTLDSAELAEWMDFLFQDRAGKLQQRAREVAELDPAEIEARSFEAVVPPDPAVVDDAEPILADALVHTADPGDAIAEAELLASSAVSPREPVAPAPAEAGRAKADTPPPLPAREGGRRRTPLWFVLLLVALGLFAAWVVVARPTPPGRTPPATAVAAERDEAPAEQAPTVDEGAAVAPSEDVEPAVTPAADAGPSETAVADAGALQEEEDAPAQATAAAPRPRRPWRPRAPAVTLRSRQRTDRGVSATAEEQTGTTLAAGTGHLTIIAHGGWAEVRIDGRQVGRTPVSRDVAAGAHRIQLRPYGEGPTAEEVVRVEAGSGLSLEFDVAER
jgi:tRNA A-37 threonylcarbamoyl transferase component Bud32